MPFWSICLPPSPTDQQTKPYQDKQLSISFLSVDLNSSSDLRCVRASLKSWNQLHVQLYLIIVALFGVYKIIERSQPDIPWLHAYFEDVVAIPIVLKTALLIVQSLHPKWRQLTFSTREVVSISALFALYFEGLMPEVSERFTRDYWDVACYALGAWLFWKAMNRPLSPMA